MDMRYVETVRACKVILRNFQYLDEHISAGQRNEISRLFSLLRERLQRFLLQETTDLGLWVGEE